MSPPFRSRSGFFLNLLTNFLCLHNPVRRPEPVAGWLQLLVRSWREGRDESLDPIVSLACGVNHPSQQTHAGARGRRIKRPTSSIGAVQAWLGAPLVGRTPPGKKKAALAISSHLYQAALISLAGHSDGQAHLVPVGALGHTRTVTKLPNFTHSSARIRIGDALQSLYQLGNTHHGELRR